MLCHSDFQLCLNALKPQWATVEKQLRIYIFSHSFRYFNFWTVLFAHTVYNFVKMLMGGTTEHIENISFVCQFLKTFVRIRLKQSLDYLYYKKPNIYNWNNCNLYWFMVFIFLMQFSKLNWLLHVLSLLTVLWDRKSVV